MSLYHLFVPRGQTRHKPGASRGEVWGVRPGCAMPVKIFGMSEKPVVLPLFGNELFHNLDGKKVYFRPSEDASGFNVKVGNTVDRNSKNHEAIPDGLYDAGLGPAISGDVCPLCERKCEGHSGYIQLREPVYKAPFFDDAKKLLTLLCPKGHGIKDPDRVRNALKNRKDSTPFDRAENEKVARHVMNGKHCLHCNQLFKGARKPKGTPYKMILTVGKKNDDSGKSRDLKLRENAEFRAKDFEEVYNHDIYVQQKDIFDKLHGGYFEFTTRRVEVLPSTCRPLTKVKDEWTSPAFFNEHYKEILKAMNLIEELEKRPVKTPEDLKTLQYKEGDIQKHVFLIWDKVKTKLNKKQGMIRSNVLGKRVDNCARSVITPDSRIDVDEVGIPIGIARRLEVSEAVNPYNHSKIVSLIDSGNGHFVQFLDGLISSVSLKRGVEPLKKKLRALADYVETPFLKNSMQILVRPLMDGDMVLINRQPTLHKASMMAHRVRVIHDDNFTIRLHVGACKPYNADYDGDEMNVHVPQTVQAQTEARLLASIQRQYFSPRDGSPQIGLIQDHVISALTLTMRNTFLTPGEAQRLVSSEAVRVRGFRMPPPSIIKAPKLQGGLYTGKQVVSIVLQSYLRDDALNNDEEVKFFNMSSKSKVDSVLLFDGDKDKVALSDKLFPGPHKMRDSEVIVRQGELCVGVIDKNQIGTEKFGLLHTIFWLYTPDVATRIVSALGRVFDEYLMKKGFSVSTNDVMLQTESELKMRKALKDAEENHVTRLGEELSVPPAKKKRHRAKFYDEIRRKYGELETEGKADPVMSEKIKSVGRETGKVLADASKIGKPVTIFPKNNFSMMIKSGAKGSQVNHNQLAFFVGQMDINGKPPPRMVNGQTLPNRDPWEPSMKANGFVMNSYSSGLDPSEMVFTTMAGRSGLVDTSVKTATSGYLQRALMKKLEDLTIKQDGTVRDAGNRVVQLLYGSDGIDPAKSDTLYHDNHFSLIADNLHVFESKMAKIREEVRILDKKKLKRAKKMMRKEEAKYGEARPLLHHIPPFSCMGATSDKFREKVQVFAAKNALDTETQEKFTDTMNLLFRMSAQEPGEPVGVAAAHSIGEPSTQMTLNTFHLAGSSDVNITMGLPRLRQLLQFGRVAQSNVTIPVSPSLSQRRIEKLTNNLMVVKLVDLITNISLTGVRRNTVDHRVMVFDLIEGYADHDLTEATLKYYAKALTDNVPKEIEKFRDLVKKKKRIRVDRIKNAKVKKASEEGAEGEEENARDEKAQDENADEDDEGSDGADYDDEPEERVAKPVLKQKKVRNMASKAKAADDQEEINDPSNYQLPTMTSVKAHFECIKDGKAKFHLWSRCNEIDVALLIQCVEKVAEGMCVKNAEFKDVTQRWVSKKGEEGEPERIELQLGGHIDKLKGPVLHLLSKYHGKFDVLGMDIDSPTLATELLGKSIGREIVAREVKKVFSFYGISVDECHLSLVAEYLSIHGEIKGAHRSNYKHDEPLQAAAFETSSAEFVHNVLRRGVDNLTNGSARHLVGLTPKTGTGSVTLVQRTPKLDFSKSEWA